MFTSITKELSSTKIAECIMKCVNHQIDNEYESSDIASQGELRSLSILIKINVVAQVIMIYNMLWLYSPIVTTCVFLHTVKRELVSHTL